MWLRRITWLIAFSAGGVTTLLSALFLYLSPSLPHAETIRDSRLQVPLRIYSRDHAMIGEFGEMRRTPLELSHIPRTIRQAVLAAEDDRFYEHFGVDLPGLIRAALQLVLTGSIQSGGSTITMQVARNYFLSAEQTFLRKFNEILLALQIERKLTKDEILELYLNKIYLGSRAYGVAAAASVYYGADITELSLAQQAMIAGLPKAPSSINPLVNPERAIARRNWVLHRMRQLDFIDEQAFREAASEPASARYHGARIEVDAKYAAEMARQELLRRFGAKIYTDGFTARTTIDSRLQAAANQALRKGLFEYDRRHGLRPWEQRIWNGSVEASRAEWLEVLGSTGSQGGLEPGFVTAVDENRVQVFSRDGAIREIDLAEDLAGYRPYISENRVGPIPASATEIVQPGDLVRLGETDGAWYLAQLPKAQAALVSMDALDGAVLAIVGGFDFHASKFNRVTQATRQPGSNIKPFLYACALEHGFTPATLINDAPVVFNDRDLESVWRPENDSGKFYGPTSLRNALVNSRNLVSIRLLKELGVDPAIDCLSRVGFDPAELPHNLSLALGTLSASPLQLVTAYASLANGGFRVYPYLIDRVENLEGEAVFEAAPDSACQDCARNDLPLTEEAANLEELIALSPQPKRAASRIFDPRVTYIIDSILRDVVQRGTGRKAKVLNRGDVAGKTGTTNGPNDAWFSGYIGKTVATAWLGFDSNRPLGRREYGGSAALPIWIDYMREASNGVDETAPELPIGLVNVRIDPKTGLRARPGQKGAIFELFRVENSPQEPFSQSDEAKTTVDRDLPPESIF